MPRPQHRLVPRFLELLPCCFAEFRGLLALFSFYDGVEVPRVVHKSFGLGEVVAQRAVEHPGLLFFWSGAVRAAAGACAYTRSPDGGALLILPSWWAALGLSGAVRAADGPCVTQGLANGGALLMPGTGAKHLAGGQPPIGRALHDFGCPDGASEFSA